VPKLHQSRTTNEGRLSRRQRRLQMARAKMLSVSRQRTGHTKGPKRNKVAPRSEGGKREKKGLPHNGFHLFYDSLKVLRKRFGTAGFIGTAWSNSGQKWGGQECAGAKTQPRHSQLLRSPVRPGAGRLPLRVWRRGAQTGTGIGGMVYPSKPGREAPELIDGCRRISFINRSTTTPERKRVHRGT